MPEYDGTLYQSQTYQSKNRQREAAVVQFLSEVLCLLRPQEIGLKPGTEIFIGQYLFTGSENVSAYLTVKQVGALCRCCIYPPH